MASPQHGKRKRFNRSRAPSPTGDYVRLKLTVESWIREVEVGSEPVKKFLSKSTDSETLAKVIQKAVQRRVESVPEGWIEPHFTTTVAIGNDERKLHFDKTTHYQLGDYPPDADGTVTCKIVLTGKQPPHAKCAVFRTPGNTNHGATAMSVEPVEVQDKDTEMQDDVQSILNRPSANRRNHKRPLHLQIGFVELGWSRNQTIRFPANATYDMMTAEFNLWINGIIRRHAPEREGLECLLRWRSEIGTETAGFQPAEEGKSLSEYPGSDEAVMMVKIQAGLIRATTANLKKENPEFLSQLPDPGVLSEWLRDLAQRAKPKSQRKVWKEERVAGTKTPRLLCAEDGRNAECYGHLVWEVNSGKAPIQAN
jgi:hypothetical protein